MSFFTGKGDGGTTKLFDSKPGERVTKTSPIFECLGMLDELNALTGWCKVEAQRQKTENRKQAELLIVNGRAMDELLRDVQDHLFTIQAEVAGAPKSVPHTSVEHLGEVINAIERSLPEVKTFLVPGGSELSARLDIARAVSRRAERRLVHLVENGERDVSASSRAYTNRLSSLFYALTRLANHHAGVEESPPLYK